MFLHQFNVRDRVVSNPGSRIKPAYDAKIDSNGVIDLVCTGCESLYDYIQSFKDSCDINLIVKKFASGDTSILSQKQGTYGDFTQMPSTYAELLNTVIAGEQMFNNLPLETRAKFNHSFREWMSSMDNWSEFTDKMGLQTEPTGSVSDPSSAVEADADTATQS